MWADDQKDNFIGVNKPPSILGFFTFFFFRFLYLPRDIYTCFLRKTNLKIYWNRVENRWKYHSPFGRKASLLLIKKGFTTHLKMCVKLNESLRWTFFAVHPFSLLLALLTSSVLLSAPLTTFSHSSAPCSHLTVSAEEGESWRQGQRPFNPTVCPLCPPYSFFLFPSFFFYLYSLMI